MLCFINDHKRASFPFRSTWIQMHWRKMLLPTWFKLLWKMFWGVLFCILTTYRQLMTCILDFIRSQFEWVFLRSQWGKWLPKLSTLTYHPKIMIRTMRHDRLSCNMNSVYHKLRNKWKDPMLISELMSWALKTLFWFHICCKYS